MSSKPKLQVKRVQCIKDQLPQLARALEAVLNVEVLVGIPATNAERDAAATKEITNAALGYIHEFGSPAANIPARPFLIPGIEKVEDDVAERLNKALTSACDMDGGKGAQAHLQAAGSVASSSVKREVGANGPPLKPSTIRNRQRGRGTKSKRESEKHYLRLIAGGMSDADAQSAAGIRPLIDTAQMRNAITYVLRKRSKAIKIPLRQLERATTPAIAKGRTK